MCKLVIDTGALTRNLEKLRHYTSARIIAVVKGGGYGLGLAPYAQWLTAQGVDMLAVSSAAEAAALRAAGITADVLMLSSTALPEEVSALLARNVILTVGSFDAAHTVSAVAAQQGVTARVHIKLDTGMHRMGFDPENDMEELIGKLKHQNAIIPRSVFSHFVGSDDDSFDDFSAHQFELFDKGSKQLQAAFDHKILRHICNSAGIEHFPERQLDMCRLGLGLYGINSRNNKTINCVSTLKTTILQMHNVKAGDSVGYSRKTILDRDSVIAAIPIGYADGLNRRLGNRHAYCLVNGQKADYVGNICMDVAMIDVTDIACKEGDSVEIFGEHLPVQTLSDILETIPYEVLTTISNRVKRVYFQD